MSTQQQTFTVGIQRANRVGLMLMIMTVCQYGVPRIVRHILQTCGIDITAKGWGLDYGTYLTLYLLMYVLMMGVPLLLGWLFIIPRKYRHLSPLNLLFDRKLCLIVAGTGACLIANIVAALFSGALYSAGLPEPQSIPTGDGTLLMLLFELVVFAVVPALMEETLLRGMVLQTLRPLGNRTALIMSAVLFGLMHGNLQQTPYALLMGLVLGSIFVHTDDLRLTIAVHMLANALSVITGHLLRFSDTGFATFWELIILVVSLMTGAVGALWLYRHPLERSKPVHRISSAARHAALFQAPLLWLAVGIMVGIMVVYIV